MDKTASKPMPSENVVVPRKLFERALQFVRGSVMFSANDIEELLVDLRRFERDFQERRSPSEPQAHPAPVSKEPGEAPQGSSVCPICGVDTPHYHPPEVVSQHYAKVNSASMNQNPDSAPLPEARGAEDETDAEATANEIGKLFQSRWGRRFEEPVMPQEIAAIIKRHTHAPGEGWVMAKVKPTMAMLEAGMAVPLAFDRHAAPTEVSAIYKSMLAAAPSPGGK